MSEEKIAHTHGPLHLGGPGTNIYDHKGWGVASAIVQSFVGNRNAEEDMATAQANARRLVACWNACQGVPTELLEHFAETRP